MTGPTPSRFDFDALYRGESPADSVPAVTTPPWDTKAPKENVVTWQEAGLIHGEVLDIGCGLGDDKHRYAAAVHRATHAGIEAAFWLLVADRG
jgi:hypothetical protein